MLEAKADVFQLAKPTLEAAVAALDPIVSLLALVQITGDRTLLHKYGPAFEGTQDTTREAFVAIDGVKPHDEANEAIANEVRQQLLDAIRRKHPVVLPHLDMPLFRHMARLALGLELPEMSLEPAYQHGGFTKDTRVRKPEKMPPADFKVLVVGAGMIGINAAVKLQQAGFNYRVVEALHDVGGNWLTNTYPGAAVDTPSRNYSFSFEPNASWTRYYPNGPEFLSYLTRVTDKYGLRERIDFNTWVEGAEWDEARKLWTVRARRDGKTVSYEANALIVAVGPNNSPKYPKVRNLDKFKGPVIHSAQWDHSVDLKGKRVVLVGTGCSGVQVATALADVVGEMIIVQRQPEHIIPNPQAHQKVDPLEIWAMENIPFVAQWKRLQGLSSQMQDMTGMLKINAEHRAKTGGVSPFNDGIRDMCANYLKSYFPDDPEMVELLTPKFPVFAKRPILDCGFYDTLKKPNVKVVRGALAECDEQAVVLDDGTRIECDAVLLCTGYNLLFSVQFDIKGRAGRTLRDAFTPSPYSYEGMLIPDFPNFILTGGPYSFLVANHAVVSEQQVHYAIELLQWMVDEDLDSVDVTQHACAAFVEDVDRELAGTTWVQCGNAHGYYRHASGKVILAIPRHNSRIWHDLRAPRTEDFAVTQRKGAQRLPKREMAMLSI
jgi:cation diffusion facilitator CzcD-associated flavoprotein CzcO